MCKAKGQGNDYGSGKGRVQDCKFPFIQHGIKYKGCAPSAEKGKGRLCATEVDKQGNLRKWARCNKYCGKDQGMNIISIIFCMTKFFFFLICIGAYVICKAAGQGKRFERAIGITEDCVFPFIYRGKKHNGCVPSSKNGKGPWCATKVDSTNKMKTNKWARCNKHCDTDKGTYIFLSFQINGNVMN